MSSEEIVSEKSLLNTRSSVNPSDAIIEMPLSGGIEGGRIIKSEPTKERFGYKGVNHLSSSALKTLTEELVRQRTQVASVKKSASYGEGLMPNRVLDKKEIEDMAVQSRKALYGTLPFVAAFGMQQMESKIKRVLSSNMSTLSLESLTKKESEQAILLSEVDLDEIIMTLPLMFAVLVAMIAQFMVGFNTGKKKNFEQTEKEIM